MYTKKFNKMKSEGGVGEWAPYSYNIGVGCEHNCLYCYARADALKYGNIVNRGCWSKENVKMYKVSITEKADGRVMFPSTHDISPEYYPYYARTLENLLKAGNEVLVVSKAHFECIKGLCERFVDYQDKLELRLTIGTVDDEVSQFWEPGAPLPTERLKALRYAYDAGYKTSVSVEPMLEGHPEAIAVYRAVEPYVTGTIWVGLMNQLEERVDMYVNANREAVERIGVLQSDANVMKLYRELKDESKVRWKDSIKQVVKRRVV